MKKRILSLFLAVLMVVMLLPVSAMAVETVDVTVSVYDYTAKDAALIGASAEGVVLSEKTVTVSEGTTALEATKKALDEETISYVVTQSTYGDYVSSVNGLAEDYSNGATGGWTFAVNNSFANSGASATAVKNGDKLEWHYTVEGYGTDVGNYWEGGPAVTAFAIGDWTGAVITDGHLGTEEDPYIIGVVLPEADTEADLTALTATVTTTLNSHYEKLSVDVRATQDYSSAVKFSVSSDYSAETWYTVIVGQAAKLSDLTVRTNTTTTNLDSAILAGANESGVPVFDPDTTEYQLKDITDTYTQLRFWYTLPDGKYSVDLIWDGGSKNLNTAGTATSMSNKWASCVSGGANELKLVVSAEGFVPTTYKLAVDSLPTLTAMTLSADGVGLILDKAFAAATEEYSTTLLGTADTVGVAVTPRNDTYTVTYNGEESSSVSIGSETNAIAIKVSAGGVENTYTVALNKVSASEIAFDIKTADAVLKVYDASGTVVKPNAGTTTYSELLTGETYTYNVSLTGYVTEHGTFIAGTDTAKEVTLTAAENNFTKYTGAWTSFRGSDDNMAIVTAETPRNMTEAEQKWAVKLGAGWTAAPTPPIMLDDVTVEGKVYDVIIVASAKNLIMLDRESGETLISKPMLGTAGFATNPVLYADGMIFVQLSGKQVQAFNATTLESVWVSENIGGQPIGPITYHDGYIYIGFWSGESKMDKFACFPVNDEDPTQTQEIKYATWTISHMGGFYWAGAYVNDNYAIFGSDDGTKEGDYSANAILYSVNPKTGEIIDYIDGIKGDIRSTVSYDAATNACYCVTKGGLFIKAPMNADGTFDKANYKIMDMGNMCTSCPVIYKGRAYVGTSGASQFASKGVLNIIDINTMTFVDNVVLPGYPQAPIMLSKAYEEATDKVYIYTTYNASPGGLFAVTWNTKTDTYDTEEIYIPDTAQRNFCICAPVCDEQGTIYYKNDSGYLMAVARNAAYAENITANGESLKYLSDAETKPFDPTVIAYEVISAENVTLIVSPAVGASVLIGVDGKFENVTTVNVTPTAQGKTVQAILTAGDNTCTYTIKVRTPSSVTTAESLKINGIEAAYDQENNYLVTLPFGSSAPTDNSAVSVVLTDAKAAWEFAETIENGWQIKVTAEDGSTTQIYNLYYTVATKLHITFNANGGTTSVAAMDTDTLGMLESLPHATLDGYDFSGWYTLEVGGVLVTTQTALTAANSTLYAHWIKQSGDTASSDSIVTTLTDGKEQLGSRLTFDVWAQNTSGAKIDSKVTLNGANVSYTWDDEIKTSYTLNFTVSGKYTVVVTAGDATEVYTINYTKVEDGEVIGEISFSLEAFTLGAGYLIDPVTVKICEGENGAQLLARILTERGYTYDNTGSLASGFYLSAIMGGRLPIKEVKVPDVLKTKLEPNGFSWSDDSTADGLGEFDFTFGSGWMYSANNVFPNVGFSDYYPSDGDVMRVQFTLTYGADIGGGYAMGGGGSSYYDIANKDEITAYIAEKGIGNVSAAVIAAAQKLDATKSELYAAIYGSGSTGSMDSVPAETTTVIIPEANVNGDMASAAVTDKNVDDAITAVNKNGDTAITIAPANTDGATNITVIIPTYAAERIAENTSAALVIESESGNVSIPNDTLAAIVEKSEGSNIEIGVEKKIAADVKDETVNTTGAVIVKVTVKSGDKAITEFGGKSLTINVPVDVSFTEGETYRVIGISADGTTHILSGKCVKLGGKLFVQTSATQLSTFVVTKDKVMPFTDVSGHWAIEAIQYAYNGSIMNGVGDNKFDPEGMFSRAMLVTMLYRMDNEPVATTENPFTDVEAGQWYTNAVIWASENKIVDGYGDCTFGPMDDITREQMAKVLYAYSQYKKYDTSKVNDLVAFSDVSLISDWALEAMKWANAEGLVTGRTAVTLAPNDTATRAEAATMLMRYLENIAK